MSDLHAEAAVQQAQLNQLQAQYSAAKHPVGEYEKAFAFGRKHPASTDAQQSLWQDNEARLHEEWKKEHDDSLWDDFKDAVQQGWESVRNAVDGRDNTAA